MVLAKLVLQVSEQLQTALVETLGVSDNIIKVNEAEYIC